VPTGQSDDCQRRILCLLAPASQPLTLGDNHDGSTTSSLALPIGSWASIMASATLCALVCGAPEEMRGKAFGRQEESVYNAPYETSVDTAQGCLGKVEGRV